MQNKLTRVVLFGLAIGILVGSVEGSAVTKWDPVTQMLDQSMGRSDFPGLHFIVYDRNDQIVYDKVYGDFGNEKFLPILSATKWVSGTTIMSLVAKGKIALSDTTSKWLGWKGPRGSITLRQLLNFTSGLKSVNECFHNHRITLQDCAFAIYTENPAEHPPGTAFDYGVVHQVVAGAMAEKATGKPWNTIFHEEMRVPLNLDPLTEYYTKPKRRKGTANPRLDGGLVITVPDYMKFLRLVFHYGRFDGKQLIPRANIEAQEMGPGHPVTIVNSFFQYWGYPYEYGLSVWRECETTACAQYRLSSPGLFGTLPWLDRRAGYYAMLFTYETRSATHKAVSLSDRLRPLIEAALKKD